MKARLYVSIYFIDVNKLKCKIQHCIGTSGSLCKEAYAKCHKTFANDSSFNQNLVNIPYKLDTCYCQNAILLLSVLTSLLHWNRMFRMQHWSTKWSIFEAWRVQSILQCSIICRLINAKLQSEKGEKIFNTISTLVHIKDIQQSSDICIWFENLQVLQHCTECFHKSCFLCLQNMPLIDIGHFFEKVDK